MCAYPVERAQAILNRLVPDASIRIVQTRPPRARSQEGTVRVLRQRVLDDGTLELLVAAEDGVGPVRGEAGVRRTP